MIADGLTRLLAPILSITAEEIWGRLPGSREESVHMALFPADTARWRDADLEERWSRLLEVRRTVYGALETARNAKTIGASLTAHVTISASGETFDLLERHEADLPMLFIVSSVSLEPRRRGRQSRAAGPRPGIRDLSMWTSRAPRATSVRGAGAS